MAKGNDKHLKNMLDNQKNYAQRKQMLIEKAKEEYGVDINRVCVEEDFDFQSLYINEDVFRSGDIQNVAIPLDDETLKQAVKLPKRVVGEPKIFPHKGKLVHGTYLQAGNEENPTMFAFSIVRNEDERTQHLNFSIKLDMLVSGKEWLPLVRLDSMGAGHPNYIRNGRVVADMDRVEEVNGAHIHINNEANQVLTDDLHYLPAEEVDLSCQNEEVIGTNKLFASALIIMFEKCGLDRSLIEDKFKNGCIVDYNSLIFEFGNEGR